MRFWDASALVTLVLDQSRTVRARELFADDPEIIVWWGSAIECASAIARLHRERPAERRRRGTRAEGARHPAGKLV